MVLISIIGDFHSSILPIFYEFKDKIKKHILIYEDINEKNFQQILNGQHNFQANKPHKYELIPIKINGLDLTEIHECFKQIQTYSDTTPILLNATDSMSFISPTLTYKMIAEGHSVIIYNRYDNSYSIHSKNNISKHKITNNMDIKTHIQLKGYNLKSYTNPDILVNRKPFIQEITKNLTKFKNFANHYRKINLTKNFYNELIHKIGNNDDDFVKGRIFEEYIYWLIKDNFDCDDIMTNVVIELNNSIKNEIDVLIIKNNHMHAIECKFTDKFKTSEYIYKMDTIIEYLDDDGKGMIVSVGNKSIGRQDLARAKYSELKIYSVKFFNEKYFLNEFKKWFKLTPTNQL